MQFVICCLVLLLQPAASEQTVGAWSADNQSVQARFLVRYHSSSLDGKTDGPYSEFLVYLELRNTAPTLSTQVRKLDLDTTKDVIYRVTDEQGRQIPPQPVAVRSTFLPGAYSLVLPPDSVLRFPVSVNGGGVFENRTKLDISPPGIWYFDAGVRRQFNLSGTLQINQPPERYQSYWWRGEIQIPPVALKIPGR